MTRRPVPPPAHLSDPQPHPAPAHTPTVPYARPTPTAGLHLTICAACSSCLSARLFIAAPVRRPGGSKVAAKYDISCPALCTTSPPRPALCFRIIFASALIKDSD